MKHHISPAQCVIDAFKGVRATAKAIGLSSPGSVVRWRKSKIKNGTGGKIPSHLMRRILHAARKRGIDLTESDLIWGRSDAPSDIPS